MQEKRGEQRRQWRQHQATGQLRTIQSAAAARWAIVPAGTRALASSGVPARSSRQQVCLQPCTASLACQSNIARSLHLRLVLSVPYSREGTHPVPSLAPQSIITQQVAVDSQPRMVDWSEAGNAAGWPAAPGSAAQELSWSFEDYELLNNMVHEAGDRILSVLGYKVRARPLAWNWVLRLTRIGSYASPTCRRPGQYGSRYLVVLE